MSLGGYDVSPSYYWATACYQQSRHMNGQVISRHVNSSLRFMDMHWGWIGFIIQVVFAASGWKINHLPQHEESIPTRTKHD